MAFVKTHLSDRGFLYTYLELNPLFNFRGVVLDLETTSYDERNGEIVCLGVVYGNRAISLVRTSRLSKDAFYSHLRELVENLRRKYKHFYAYNCDFEETWLKKHLNLHLEFEEIMKPAKGITMKLKNLRGKYKLPKLRELLHPRFFHYFGFAPWDIDSGDVKELWEEHLKNGNIEPLNLIAQHNLLDLLSELELLAIWNPFMEEFLNRTKTVESFSSLRCELCKKEKPVEEFAVITYPERKKNGGFRFREIRVCKSCLNDGIAK